MSFFSAGFLLFLTVVFVLYYFVPVNRRYLVLLISSYVFYVFWDYRYVAVLLAVTMISYTAARFMDRPYKKALLILGITACVGTLIFFKFNYVLIGAVKLFEAGNDLGVMNAARIAAPVGLSFYVLEAIGYMADVYQQKTEVQKDPLRYALFLSFFPIVLSGPIERSAGLLPQIYEDKIFNYEGVRHGLCMMLWGYMMKLLIADRISVIVNAAYKDYASMTGFTLAFAVVLYGIQLYADFAGYSFIATGMGRIFGYRILTNFRQPYLSESILEFWSRWHISLSNWLRDYIYIPLGGNRHGRLRKCINLMITFLISGIWHGEGLQFIFWGALHGVYQIVGTLVHRGQKPEKSEAPNNIRTGLVKVIRIVITFILADLAWLFFRAGSLTEGFGILGRILFNADILNSVRESAFLCGYDPGKFIWLLIWMMIMFTVDILREKGVSVYRLITGQRTVIRWSIYLGAVLLLLLGIIRDFGMEASEFIYARF